MAKYLVGWLPSSDELWHHGIKGMKWGVRRYQNPDGTLTEAGIKRYFRLKKASKYSDIASIMDFTNHEKVYSRLSEDDRNRLKSMYKKRDESYSKYRTADGNLDRDDNSREKDGSYKRSLTGPGSEFGKAKKQYEQDNAAYGKELERISKKILGSHANDKYEYILPYSKEKFYDEYWNIVKGDLATETYKSIKKEEKRR